MTGALAVLALFLLAESVIGMLPNTKAGEVRIILFLWFAMLAGYGAWVLR